MTKPWLTILALLAVGCGGSTSDLRPDEWRMRLRGWKVVYEPKPDELAFYRESGGAWKEQFWQGEGCNLCSNTGYQERIGAYELLVVTDEIKNLIVKGGTHEELRAMAVSQGMHPLREQATRLVTQDVTTIAEVMRSIYTL